MAGDSKPSLEQALRVECTRRATDLIAFERPARNRIHVTVRHSDRYWTLMSECPYVDLSSDDLDDWLFGDFADNVLSRLGGSLQ